MRVSNQLPPVARTRATPHAIEILLTKANALSMAAPGEQPDEASARRLKLSRLDVRIEQLAVSIVEEQMVLGIGGLDGISRQELTELATNPFGSDHVKAAAEYLLANGSKRRKLETASSHDNQQGSSGNRTISIADIHARQFMVDSNIPERTQAPGATQPYQVPTDSTTYVTGALDSPRRPELLYANQQDAVEFAIRTGIPTAFRNSSGEISSVKITPLTAGSRAGYRVSLGSGERINVQSSISTADTIEAIANVIEWGTTFHAKPGIREFPDRVVFDNRPYSKGRSAASYHGHSHTMTFYEGGRYISEANYNHEMAHGIGWQLDDTGTRFLGFNRSIFYRNRQDYTPEHWESVVAAANTTGSHPVTVYAGVTASEDFAESLSAYMHARDNGPAALRTFRAVYPQRSAFIEKTVFSTAPMAETNGETTTAISERAANCPELR